MYPPGAISSGAANQQQAVVTASRQRDAPQQPPATRPAAVKATPPPLTRHDARVDALSRRLKTALVHLQEEADFGIQEEEGSKIPFRATISEMISSGWWS